MIQRGRSYCIDLQVKMEHPQRPVRRQRQRQRPGNRDGELRTWVNGVLAYEATNMRWTRHPEMGVQGGWLNVFQGGTQNSPRDMGHRIDRVVLARLYVGPPWRRLAARAEPRRHARARDILRWRSAAAHRGHR
jgi:hypothetical protein